MCIYASFAAIALCVHIRLIDDIMDVGFAVLTDVPCVEGQVLEVYPFLENINDYFFRIGLLLSLIFECSVLSNFSAG